MRHIVDYDTELAVWLVVDTEAAHMVISIHPTRRAARRAAWAEEAAWPRRHAANMDS
jgi:hypothetical protein